MSSHAEDEILLSAERLSADFRQLKRGEVIEVGYLFQEPHQTRKMTPGGMMFRFLPVKPDTFVNGAELVGIAYDPSYPMVVRPLPKPDLFALAGDDAPTIFCKASKDMIRGELIAIRLGPRSTLTSDKLDFSNYNADRERSIAPMKPSANSR